MAVCESTPDSLCDAVTNSEAISFGDAFDGDINIPSSRRRLGFCKEGDDDHHDGQSWQRGDHHGDPHDDPHQAHDCNTFWDGSTIKTRAGAASPLDRPWLSRASSAVSGSVRVQTTGKAFGSWSLFHSFYNLNDGLYGNSKSWCPLIYSGHPSDKAGVVLPAPQTIVGIQFARDLTGEVKDGAGGVVTVEYSATANSDANPGAWASSNGWVLVGRLTGWAANTRNYYEFNTPVVADGLRVTVDTNADGQLTCIDELEIYSRSPGPPSPPPPGPSPPVVVVSPSSSPPVVVVSPSPSPLPRCSSVDRYPTMSLKSWYLDHTNGGSGKWSQCEEMCRADPSCHSWMWRNSGGTCYLSVDSELMSGITTPDHHPHTLNAANCLVPPPPPPNLRSPTSSPTVESP